MQLATRRLLLVLIVLVVGLAFADGELRELAESPVAMASEAMGGDEDGSQAAGGAASRAYQTHSAARGAEPSAGASSSQPNAPVQLRSRALSRHASRQEALRAIAEIPPEQQHTVIIELDAVQDAEDRRALEADGVRLLEYLGGETWFASVGIPPSESGYQVMSPNRPERYRDGAASAPAIQ